MRTRLLSSLVLLLALAVPGFAQSELFISEYVEGTYNNKALEIYNPGAAAVDLSLGGYTVQIFSNGSATASATITLTGVVASGGRFVLANSSAVLGMTPNQTSGSLNFNGDDAVTLR
ncbi:MAG TPA: lamin tail domain-containing protein, partial [Thermoanaerobaculia bacterium]|nr:lamin tail domain-containing protein [Thermoanaerobaculia bacterium]